MAADFIPYMERTRLYYRAQGFEKDYVWASHEETPFTPLAKPLPECTVTLVTTAVAHPDIPKPVRKAESIPFSEVPDSFLTDELSWDKETTHTDDRESYFPVESLNALTDEGVIGSLAKHFHFVPTQYSHRATKEEDAPAIAAACRKDGVDIALLVPI
jgi:D-proline reductase (dithiol) PrdB